VHTSSVSPILSKPDDSSLASSMRKAIKNNELGGARGGRCVVCEAVKIEVELLARKSHFCAKTDPLNGLERQRGTDQWEAATNPNPTTVLRPA
jgi:hypothetical protein